MVVGKSTKPEGHPLLDKVLHMVNSSRRCLCVSNALLGTSTLLLHLLFNRLAQIDPLEQAAAGEAGRLCHGPL